MNYPMYNIHVQVRKHKMTCLLPERDISSIAKCVSGV